MKKSPKKSKKQPVNLNPKNPKSNPKTNYNSEGPPSLGDAHMDENEANVLDLGANRRGDMSLDESWLAMMGGAIETILGGMFGGYKPNILVRGSRREIDSFSKTLSSEKKYIQAYNKYGLNDPKTYKSKFQLNNAISKFTRTTGLQWPFK